MCIIGVVPVKELELRMTKASEQLQQDLTVNDEG